MQDIIGDYTERIEKFKERIRNNKDGDKFYEKRIKEFEERINIKSRRTKKFYIRRKNTIIFTIL